MEKFGDFVWCVPWTLDVRCIGNRWCHNWNFFMCHAVVNAAQALAAMCMSKQAPFFACTPCRKLTQNASKCGGIVNFWQWLEGQDLRKGQHFWLKSDAGWSHKSVCQTCSQTFSMEGTMVQGAKVRWPDSAKDLQLVQYSGTTYKLNLMLVMRSAFLSVPRHLLW